MPVFENPTLMEPMPTLPPMTISNIQIATMQAPGAHAYKEPTHWLCHKAEVLELQHSPRWSRWGAELGLSAPHSFFSCPLHTWSMENAHVCSPHRYSGRHPALSPAGGAPCVPSFSAHLDGAWAGNWRAQGLLCSSHFWWSSELGSQENADRDTQPHS